MSLIVQRRDYGYNPSHWAAPRLLFAWRGGVTGSKYVQNAVRGRERLAQTTAPIVASRDGFGISSTAASEYWSATNRHPSAFGGDLTMLWRGVILGDPGATNKGVFCGVLYGTGGGSPYTVFSFSRVNALPNNIAVATNTGASYVESSTAISLSSYYNIPLTIAVSNVAGSNSPVLCIGSPARGFIAAPGLNNFSSASGNPRLTSASDILIIGENQGAGRFSNSVTTGVAMWNIAMNAQQLRNVALRSDDVFAAPALAMPTAFMLSSASPPAEPGGGSGYKPFKGPFGHPFNVPF